MEEEVGVPGEFGKVCYIKKERRKRQKLLITDLFFDFAKNTTLHGLRYVTEVGLTVVEKVFWVLTFLISVVLCFVLIERVLYKWLYSPVIVSFNEQMIPVGEVPFPSITICPQWKCKISAYNYTDNLIKYRAYRKHKNRKNNATDEFAYEDQVLLDDAFLVCGQDNKPATTRSISNASLVDNLINMAPSVDESLLSCQWRGHVTSCNELFKMVLTSEGVCFNFNALSYKDIFKNKNIQRDYKYIYSDTPIHKWDIISGYTNSAKQTRKKKRNRKVGPKKTTAVVKEVEEYPRRGQENGAHPDLEILLVEDTEDVDDSCNSLSNGWKIYLQHPADMPQASLYYYAAIGEQVTSLALKFSILNTSESLLNYNPSQRQCYFPKDRQLQYFATYTPDNCRLECLSLFTYKRCKCVWFNMPHTNSSEICTMQKLFCVENALDEYALSKEQQGKCNCLPSCDSVHYDAEILKTNFDINKYRKSMKKIYNSTMSAKYKYSRLEIYFKEPRFVSMRRSELYGLTDFLAACGGLLGLFLGFSFLSLVEIFYFCTLREEGTPVSGEGTKVCQIKKDRRKRQKLLMIDLFLDFAQNTTLHGLRYIAEVGLTVVEKVFWILTFMISVILCFLLIENVWYKWWNSPVIVSFNENMVSVGEVPFPSVTICPQWKLKVSAYNYTENVLMYNKRNLYNTYNATETDEINEGQVLLDSALLVCAKTVYKSATSRYMSDATLVKNLVKMAPAVRDTMYGCSWRGVSTNCENLFKMVLTSEGVCYNFNGLSYLDIFQNESIQKDYMYINSNKPTNKWSVESGYANTEAEDDSEEYPRRGQENGANPDLKVRLVEDITNIDTVCNSLSNGWKIYLQRPTDMPQASLYYYAAIRGQLTSLALKFSILNTSSRLMGYKAEQRQCFFPNDRQLQYFATYTPDNCRLECLSIHTYRKCKCVWFHMPHTNSSEICTANKRECVNSALDEVASNKRKTIDCNCLPMCESVQYDAETLKTNLDMEALKDSYLRIHGITLSNRFKYSSVEMYYKEPRFVSMRRSELFGITDFLANCGGLLGLFLGFSFLSLVEMFYFCTLRLWRTLKYDIKTENGKKVAEGK